MMRRLSITILTAGFISGCQVNTTHLQHDYKAPPASLTADIASQHDMKCPITLFSYEDHRQSKTMGSVAFTIVESDVDRWVASALDHVNISHEALASGGMLKLTLAKAYIQSLRGNMAANVVFGAQFKGPEDEEFSDKRYFRGHEVEVNFSSTQGEIKTTLNKAIAKALARIKAAYSESCTAVVPV